MGAVVNYIKEHILELIGLGLDLLSLILAFVEFSKSSRDSDRERKRTYRQKGVLFLLLTAVLFAFLSSVGVWNMLFNGCSIGDIHDNITTVGCFNNISIGEPSPESSPTDIPPTSSDVTEGTVPTVTTAFALPQPTTTQATHNTPVLPPSPPATETVKTTVTSATSPTTVTTSTDKTSTTMTSTTTTGAPDVVAPPSGYTIRSSRSRVFINEDFTVTVTPNESDYTNITLYAIDPTGVTWSFNLGRNTRKNFELYREDLIGTWTLYANITNSAGTFSGYANGQKTYVTLVG